MGYSLRLWAAISLNIDDGSVTWTHMKQNWSRKMSKMVKWGGNTHKLASGRGRLPKVEIFQRLNGKLDRTNPCNHKSPKIGKVVRILKCIQAPFTEVLLHLRGRKEHSCFSLMDPNYKNWHWQREERKGWGDFSEEEQWGTHLSTKGAKKEKRSLR